MVEHALITGLLDTTTGNVPLLTTASYLPRPSSAARTLLGGHFCLYLIAQLPTFTERAFVIVFALPAMVPSTRSSIFLLSSVLITLLGVIHIGPGRTAPCESVLLQLLSDGTCTPNRLVGCNFCFLDVTEERG